MAQVINDSIKQPNKSGSGFTNLQRFLDVNKQNRLGQTVASGVGGVAQGAKDAIGQSQQQFQQQTEKDRLDTDVNRTRIKDVVANAPNMVGTGPNRTQEQQKTLQDFGRYRSGIYTGQNELKDFGALQSKAQEAQQLGQAATSGSGRMGLLQRFAGGGTQPYTQGQQRLDSLLLERQKAPLAQTVRQTQGISEEANRQQEAARLYAQNLGEKAKGFAKETEGEISKSYDPLNADIEQKYQDVKNMESDRMQSIQDMKDYLSMQGTAEIFDPITGKIKRAAQSGPGSEAEAISKALGIAGEKGYINSQGVDRLSGLYRMLQTPVEQLVQSQHTSGEGSYYGWGTPEQKSFEYSTTPVMSGLKLNELIKQNILEQEAKNIGRQGVAQDFEESRINALNQLAGRQEEFTQPAGDWRMGTAGIDIDAIENAINDDVSRLRGITQTGRPTFSHQKTVDKLRRGLFPTIQETEEDNARDWDATFGDEGDLSSRWAGSSRLGVNHSRAIMGNMYNAGKGIYDAGDMILNPEETFNKDDTPESAQKKILAKDQRAGAGLVADYADSTNQAAKGLKNIRDEQVDTIADMPKKQAKAFIDSGTDFNKRLAAFQDIASTPIVKAAQGYQNIGGAISRIPVIGEEINKRNNMVSNFVQDTFCYATGTSIKMSDGKYKKIEKLEIGDEVELGGKVLGIGETVPEELYKYKDVLVTGPHMVLEDGKFIRVKNSKLGKKSKNRSGIKVHPIVTEKHLLVTKTHIGCDLSETDEGSKVSDAQREIEVNKNKQLINLLVKKEGFLFDKSKKN